VDLYERLGFLRYKDNVLSPAQGYVAPMVMLNEDAVHFKAVRSHFLRTCLANRPDRATAEWFDRTFPEMRTSARKQALSPAAMCAQWGAAMSAENVTLLHGLTPAHIECLVEAGTVLRCRGGDTVLREGEPGHEMFLILEGLAHFSKQGADGAETPLRTLGSGEVFGEIALFSRIRRTASVRAVTDLQVLVISQEFLRRAMRAMPEIAMKLLYNLNAVLCERLDRTTNEWMTAIARPSAGQEKNPHATVGT
jgi:CRP-like cAMP-binding protein